MYLVNWSKYAQSAKEQTLIIFHLIREWYRENEFKQGC